VDRAVYRETRSTVERETQPRRASMPKPKSAPVEPEGEFYAIDGVGNIDRAAGGRIIRVDVARSSLFAMGMNVPLENESPVVKADLLVGPDGITRGIRVVK
jgi:hypothetical protein